MYTAFVGLLDLSLYIVLSILRASAGATHRAIIARKGYAAFRWILMD